MVYGRINYDDYLRDYVMRPSSISTVEAVETQDTAEEKRVELHLHTSMSAMDGMTPAGDLVMRAYQYGHPAIAITDHGVVQAFPDAAKAQRKIRKKGGDIKIIYGVEAYMVNDVITAATGGDEPFDGTFVVFDVETTGINAAKERLTEIGAVRMVNGEKTEVFKTYVNPERPIPEHITELTGIDDRMVADAPLEEEAVRQFLAFCGDSILVAHNAKFDMGFIEAAAKRHDIPFDNPSIDTLVLCRSLLTETRNHKLDTVAKALLGSGNLTTTAPLKTPISSPKSLSSCSIWPKGVGDAPPPASSIRPWRAPTSKSCRPTILLSWFKPRRGSKTSTSSFPNPIWNTFTAIR